jgi:hypothetical protein
MLPALIARSSESSYVDTDDLVSVAPMFMTGVFLEVILIFCWVFIGLAFICCCCCCCCMMKGMKTMKENAGEIKADSVAQTETITQAGN